MILTQNNMRRELPSLVRKKHFKPDLFIILDNFIDQNVVGYFVRPFLYKRTLRMHTYLPDDQHLAETAELCEFSEIESLHYKKHLIPAIQDYKIQVGNNRHLARTTASSFDSFMKFPFSKSRVRYSVQCGHFAASYIHKQRKGRDGNIGLFLIPTNPIYYPSP